MDFKALTRKLVAEFSGQGVAYALIGGYAVGLWGVVRGTVDMDFLVRRDDLPKVDGIMKSLGYEVRFSSENVTQYRAASGSYGEIDYLHAFRAASLRMLERSVVKTLLGDGVSLRVLVPEDLIGLKIQATANDARRTAVDMDDIEKLLEIHGKTLDWELIRQYFEIFELASLYQELERKYHAAY